MDSKQPLASIKNVSVGYGGTPVLTDVNLDIYPLDFIGLIGPNGGGKTTLSKVLLGILKPYRGRVLFPSGRINIGYLPQISRIDRSFPITVKEVILSGVSSRRNWWKSLFTKTEGIAEKLLDELGLEGYEDRAIGQLSGGQLQRVLLARAIVNNPQLLILDEPNTFVDRNFEAELYKILERLNKRMSIVLISHDIGTISSIVKTIACVNGTLHYHPSNELTEEVLHIYNCPIDLITHGELPHRVLKQHS
jgi:zinc transport system ATP-binding protein